MPHFVPFSPLLGYNGTVERTKKARQVSEHQPGQPLAKGATMNSLPTDQGPCRCWAGPARLHEDHCCMERTDQTCHQDEGMSIFRASEVTTA